MKAIPTLAVLLVGCGGSGISPYAGSWSGRYEVQNDATDKGAISAVIGADGSGTVTLDGLSFSVQAADGEVSGRLLGRLQIENGRLGFRLSDGGRVLYGRMVKQ